MQFIGESLSIPKFIKESKTILNLITIQNGIMTQLSNLLIVDLEMHLATGGNPSLQYYYQLDLYIITKVEVLQLWPGCLGQMVAQ